MLPSGAVFWLGGSPTTITGWTGMAEIVDTAGRRIEEGEPLPSNQPLDVLKNFVTTCERSNIPVQRVYLLVEVVHAYLTSCDLDFPTLDGLASQIDDHDLFKPIVIAGASILRHHDKNVAAMVAATRHRETVAGYEVPVANLPPVFASDAGNIMARGEPFAAIWYEKPDGSRSWSLRSDADGLDVSEIAATFGGGGHARAAGFTMPK